MDRKDEPKNQLRVKLFALGVCIGAIAILRSSLGVALSFAFHDDRYLQIIALPLIAAYLIYWERQDIFSKATYSPRPGLPLLTLGAILCLITASRSWSAEPIINIVPSIISIVTLIEAAFVLCFGIQSFKAAGYSMLCMWLAVPVPPSVIDALTVAYQHGSAAISLMLLEVAGVSVLRDGTSFSIPGLDFTIAPECSGIRSGLAFLLVGILAGRLYLRSPWVRSILILSTIPIAMFKNAIRIVVTTSLAAYVDRSFIDGPFHHQYGGVIFSPLDFLLFVPLLLGLRRLEKQEGTLQSSEVALSQ
jgi:exosortase